MGSKRSVTSVVVVSLLLGTLAAFFGGAAAVAQGGGCVDKVEIESPDEVATRFGAVEIQPGETFTADIRYWTSSPTSLNWIHNFNGQIRLSVMRPDGFPGDQVAGQSHVVERPFDADGFRDAGQFTYTNPANATRTQFVLELGAWNRPSVGVITRMEARNFTLCVSSHSPPERPEVPCSTMPSMRADISDVVNTEPFFMPAYGRLDLDLMDEREFGLTADGFVRQLHGDWNFRVRLYKADGTWITTTTESSAGFYWTREAYLDTSARVYNDRDAGMVYLQMATWFTRGGGQPQTSPIDARVNGESICLESKQSLVVWDTEPRCAADDSTGYSARVTNKLSRSENYVLRAKNSVTNELVASSDSVALSPGRTARLTVAGLEVGRYKLAVYEGTRRLSPQRYVDIEEELSCPDGVTAPEDLEIDYETGNAAGVAPSMEALWTGTDASYDVRWYVGRTSERILADDYEFYSEQQQVNGASASYTVPASGSTLVCVAVRSHNSADATSEWRGPVCDRVLRCVGMNVTAMLSRGESPTSGNDSIRGTAGADTINALEGDDRICSLGGSDTIDGGPGIDRVYASGGDDEVSGGPDNDYLYGGNGKDILNGDGGDDFINGQAGDDIINGGEGDDRLYGSTNVDTIKGGPGNDTISGANGHDILDGEAGDDTVRGQGGNDVITGGADNDILIGGSGADDISGGDGTDDISGQGGNDMLRGGAGNDNLVGGGGDDSLDGGEGNDTGNGTVGTNECTNIETTENCELDTNAPTWPADTSEIEHEIAHVAPTYQGFYVRPYGASDDVGVSFYRVATDAGQLIDIAPGDADFVTYTQGQKLLVQIEAVDAAGNISTGGPSFYVGGTLTVSGPPVGGCAEGGEGVGAADEPCAFFPPVAALTWGHPLSDPEQVVTSYRGWRELGGRDNHSGIDLNSTSTTNPQILAVSSGTIALHDPCFGAVAIDHDDGTRTYSLHMQSFAAGITLGATVQKGQPLGIMGGILGCGDDQIPDSTVPVHLHFEVFGPGTFDPGSGWQGGQLRDETAGNPWAYLCAIPGDDVSYLDKSFAADFCGNQHDGAFAGRTSNCTAAFDISTMYNEPWVDTDGCDIPQTLR